jgi:hypothetical protein
MNEGHNEGKPRKMKTAITTFQSEMVETIKNRAENDMESVDQLT